MALAYDEALPLLRSVVDEVTLKEFAWAVDEQPSNLGHALAERYQHAPKLKLALGAVLTDESRRFIRFLCRLAGGRFVEDPKITPEEELRRTREWLESNPALLAAWRAEVHGK